MIILRLYFFITIRDYAIYNYHVNYREKGFFFINICKKIYPIKYSNENINVRTDSIKVFDKVSPLFHFSFDTNIQDIYCKIKFVIEIENFCKNFNLYHKTTLSESF